MKDCIDIHSHLLWGLDDGPETMEETIEMLRQAQAEGVARIVATPHACPGFRPFDEKMFLERLQQAQRAADEMKLGIEILPGAEIAWTYNTVEALRQKRVPTLNHSEYALLEFWEGVSWNRVASAVMSVLRAGFVPVIAHVERYRAFTHRPRRAIAFKNEKSVLYQVNAGAVISGSLLQKRLIKMLLKAGAVDMLASDAHGAKRRKIRFREACKALEKRCTAEDIERMLHFPL